MQAKTAINRILVYSFLIAGAVSMVLPFFWMISTSLKAYASVFIFNLNKIQWLPNPVYWGNYIDVWKVVPFAWFYFNSLFVCITVTIAQVSTSALAAYAFSRLKFPGREKLFFSYYSFSLMRSRLAECNERKFANRINLRCLALPRFALRSKTNQRR